MKKYQLTEEDIAQDRKYWTTKYWPALHKEMVKKGERGENVYNGKQTPTHESSRILTNRCREFLR